MPQISGEVCHLRRLAAGVAAHNTLIMLGGMRT